VSATAASEPPFDALVLDVDARAGLAIVRALGRGGLRVAAAARDGSASGLRSRHAAARVVLPDPERDFGAYADAIAEWAERHGAGAIVPSIDVSVAALDRRRERLASHAAPAIAAPEPLAIAVSKPRTLELAARLGIAAPRGHEVQTPGDLRAAADELGYPLVVKPVESWRDEEAGGERLAPVLVEHVAGLAAAEALLPALAQELAPGERVTVKLFRVEGRVVVRFAMRVERSWPPLGGSSVLRESIALPRDATEPAEALVEAIGLDGYSEVEFRRGRDGRPLLMEVNARLSQSVELAVRAGVDFPRLQLEWARGGDVRPVAGYRVGVRLGWLAGDLRLAAAALAGIGPPPRPPRPPLARDYLLGRARIEGLDVRDPAPVAGALAFAARGLRRRGTRRRGASPG
jgi:predicted ATP-grasp superfamily ATP-dependent carboligase